MAEPKEPVTRLNKKLFEKPENSLEANIDALVNNKDYDKITRSPDNTNEDQRAIAAANSSVKYETSKNLNNTLVTILLDDYAADVAAGSPHPIRYVLYDRAYRSDIFYLIKKPVDIPTLKRTVRSKDEAQRA
ncbi:hypothetical protein BT63DRAFT_444292 [Microthyrium microscopicum]|uniref:Uncharacterized protein n=1 Tax=Microthyrium microscopicum TaxID=703497 RepID=A0A6A6TXW0_9PEZI|nr:hypothetical protein BT63DRAFT_444292 [Microthyrium microscopicum]